MEEEVWSALERGQVYENPLNNLDLLCSPDYSCRRYEILIQGLFAHVATLPTDMQITF